MGKTKGQGKTPSRAKQRQALIAQAATTVLPAPIDVIVVGGGASGLVAAITSAERGARVVVLERDLECGRTILATGNGRCNLANTQLDPTLFHEGSFVKAVVGPSWTSDVLSFFRDCGLALTEEGEGRLYPLSRQAASVREVLLARARRSGVTLATAREVIEVRKASAGFAITGKNLFEEGAPFTLTCAAVVLAQGHSPLSIPGISARPLVGVLCPIQVRDETLPAIDGRRAQAMLTLKRDGRTIAVEQGEVLFRKGALSGICVFNLSRHARPQDTITLDLLPTLSAAEARLLCQDTLAGVLDPQIASALIGRAGSIDSALRLAKSWDMAVIGLTDTERAQVMRGGLEVSQFSDKTLQATDHPGLFACGEALDVDGPCGGYNLGWAWKSALVAGEGAAQASTGKARGR